MDAYRRAVEDALKNKAQVACFLSEEWTGGYDDVVQKCHDRVLASFGFLLLLGYNYGWVPGNRDKSITHLEFEWALGRWGRSPYPPMAVFAPENNSEAEKELRAEAAKYIPTDAPNRKLHDDRLQAFRSEVLNAGRTAQFYVNRQELRENAIVACLQWTGKTPLSVARGVSRSTGSLVTDEQLGLLGRKAQMDGLAEIIAQFNAKPDEPACALLVHGDEDAGQRVFLARLANCKELAGCRPACPGHPPMDQYDATVLGQWVARSLGLGRAADAQNIAQLATAIASELRNQPLLFILDRVQRLSGDLASFVTQFWRPLRERLRAIHAERPLPYPLIALVADYKGNLAGREAYTCAWCAPTLDYSVLLAMPRMTDFRQKDIFLWLDELAVPDRPAGRRTEIAISVVKNAGGQPEGKPLRVYEELRSINLFADES
jgi:inactive STAND/Domain of unknown function (DUF4062)